MHAGLKIETPRGTLREERWKDGRVVAVLRWNKDFQPKWQGRYNIAQQFIDAEVLRGCDKYTPFQIGMLKKSGILGTFVGEGKVSWIAPYARYQYYLPNRKVKLADAGTLRGSFWFERWKAANVDRVTKRARKLAAGADA